MLRRILLGWDLWLSLLASLLGYFVFPAYVDNIIAKEVYGAGLSVLSITFAVFFTALAVIIAAGDDEFVLYLREAGVYEKLVMVYGFTLGLLFVSLLLAIGAFVVTAAFPEYLQSRWIIIVFLFFFLYSLFSTMGSTRDSLKYAKYRLVYLVWSRKRPPADGPK